MVDSNKVLGFTIFLVLLLAALQYGTSFSIYPSSNTDWLENKKDSLEAAGDSCTLVEDCGRTSALFCGDDNTPSKIDSYCESIEYESSSFSNCEGDLDNCYRGSYSYGDAKARATVETANIYSFTLDGRQIISQNFQWQYSCDADKAYLFDLDEDDADCDANGCTDYVARLSGSGVIRLENYAPIRPQVLCWSRDDNNGYWSWVYVYTSWSDTYYAGTWECEENNDCSSNEQCSISNTGSSCEALSCSGDRQYIEDHQCLTADSSIDDRCVAAEIYTSSACDSYLEQFVEVLPVVEGCTDAIATNFDADAEDDDGSCLYAVGCIDPLAVNYDVDAVISDDSCAYQVETTNESSSETVEDVETAYAIYSGECTLIALPDGVDVDEEEAYFETVSSCESKLASITSSSTEESSSTSSSSSASTSDSSTGSSTESDTDKTNQSASSQTIANVVAVVVFLALAWYLLIRKKPKKKKR